MRHVVTEPQPGSVVRLRAGDWLELRLTHTDSDADWQVVDQPGCLFPVADAVSHRPAVLPAGPRQRSWGFLAFGTSSQQAQPLRLALVDRRRPGRGQVCEVSVLVG